MPAERTRARPSRETADRTIDWAKLIETALTVEGSVGDVYNRFHDYSFMNQMLLRMQGVTEPVATYKRWQSLGRQVLKGSKAKQIVRPVIIEKKNDAGEVDNRKSPQPEAAKPTPSTSTSTTTRTSIPVTARTKYRRQARFCSGSSTTPPPTSPHTPCSSAEQAGMIRSRTR